MARERLTFSVARTLHGGPAPIKNLPLVSATYYEGQVLRLSGTSGSATKAAAAGTSILGVLGVSLSTANSTTADYPVYLADPGTLFKGKMIGSSTGQQKVGDLVKLAVSGNTHSLQTTAGTASTGVFVLHGFDPDSRSDGDVSAATGLYYYASVARYIFGDTRSSSAA